MSGKKSAAVPSKRTVYIILVMILGFLLSNVIYIALVVSYPDFFIPQEDAFCPSCQGVIFDLYPLPQMVFAVMGVIGGYYLGKLWWQVVYVDQTFRGRKKRKICRPEW